MTTLNDLIELNAKLNISFVILCPNINLILVENEDLDSCMSLLRLCKFFGLVQKDLRLHHIIQ